MSLIEWLSEPVVLLDVETGSGLSPLDLIGLTLFLIFTVGYHGVYYLYAQRRPLSTVKGKIHLYRRTWIKRIMDRGDYILAVQAFRNLNMASSFMASSSLIVIGVLFNFAITGNYQSVLIGERDRALIEAKLWLLIAIYAFSFWQFLLNIRLLSQLTVLLGADPDLIDHIEGVDAVTYFATILNRATNRFTYGQRGFYFSLAILAWVFSSWLFVLVTLFIGLFLVGTLDFQKWRPPKALRREAEDFEHGSMFHHHLSPAHHSQPGEQGHKEG